MRGAFPTLTLLALLGALAGTPWAQADHVGQMAVRQTGATLAHGVSLTAVYTLTGRCCGGLFEWQTGDGATGILLDGVTNGVYDGDASGTGRLTDGRPFTWSRMSPPASGVVALTVSYQYPVAGVYTVTWRDCCPVLTGTLDVVAL